MTININVNIDYKGLDLLLKQQSTIISKLNQIMTQQERFDAMLADLDATTNDIAADYQKLIDAAKNAGVTDESLAKGEANVEKLKGISGQVDSTTPVVAPE